MPARRDHRSFGIAVVDDPAALGDRLGQCGRCPIVAVAELVLADEFAIAPGIVAQAERLRRGFNLYAVPSPVPPAASERDGLAALIRSIPGVNILHGKGLETNSALTLVDAMP